MIADPIYYEMMQNDFAKFGIHQALLKEFAAQRKEELLRMNFDKIKQEDFIEFALQIMFLYQDLVFYPDDEIIDAFENFGLSDKHLRWFTPIELIEDEYLIIDFGSPLFIFPYISTWFIQNFFETKIINEIIEWAGFVRPFEKGKYRNILYLAYLKREKKIRRNNNFFPEIKNPDIIDVQFKSLIKVFNNITETVEDSRKLLLKYSEAKLEPILIRSIVQTVLDCKKITGITLSERKTIGYLYELLRIILKDHNLLTKRKFKILKPGLYEDEFARYQVSNINKILQLKKPEIF